MRKTRVYPILSRSRSYLLYFYYGFYYFVFYRSSINLIESIHIQSFPGYTYNRIQRPIVFRIGKLEIKSSSSFGSKFCTSKERKTPKKLAIHYKSCTYNNKYCPTTTILKNSKRKKEEERWKKSKEVMKTMSQ